MSNNEPAIDAIVSNLDDMYCEHCSGPPEDPYKEDGKLYCGTCGFNLGYDSDDPIMREFDETIEVHAGTLRFRGTARNTKGFIRDLAQLTQRLDSELCDLEAKERAKR